MPTAPADAAPADAATPAATPAAAYRSVADAQRPWWALADGSECENCAHQGARCGDHH
jgi:hypothetical protein